MTNYGKWEAKANVLVKEADEEDAREAKASDTALGLTGEPEGPPVAAAKKQQKELEAHSAERKDFIEWMGKREVTLTHDPQEGEVTLGAEVAEKGVRLSKSRDVSYVVPEGTRLLKLMLDGCQRVRVRLEGQLVTSTLELDKCSDVEVAATTAIGTVQADRCPGNVLIRFAERGDAAAPGPSVYHAGCPKLRLALGPAGPVQDVGSDEPAQLCTQLAAAGPAAAPFVTAVLQRGEGDWPTFPDPDVAKAQQAAAAVPAEVMEAAEAEERRLRAKEAREKGNASFRTSDFAQAACEYTRSLDLDPAQAGVWANRSQCWLRLGDHSKAHADAAKCSEVDPSNVKGWFRQGIALHAMGRYPEAIPMLLKAEELEPKNKQITDAIRMAQLKARENPGGA